MHLAEYMAWKKLSDAEVAKRIGKSRPTVSRIRRKAVRPDWDTIALLKKYSLGQITADDFADAPRKI